MVSFPPCKINLGLHVVRKRPDGYHDLETCFYPVPWTDILEIIPASKNSFTNSGISVHGNPEDNLCLKAYHLLANDFKLPPVSIHLHKVIPMGAGLGGGSSDAAHTLRLLNTLFELNLSREVLTTYASILGSDCSFFIFDQPMIGTGRGEILTAANVNLSGKFLVLVKPDVHISTAQAYGSVAPGVPSIRLSDALRQSFTHWKKNLVNDFEKSVFQNHQQLAEIKNSLYAMGAEYASMSGSGSSLFGIFDKPVTLKTLPSYTCWSGTV